MARSNDEWKGKTDDTQIPARVKLRIFDRFGGCCCGCGRHIRGRLLPRYDHSRALINGGENRESNIQLLCHECDRTKTNNDVREKSVIYQKRVKRLKLKARRLIPGSKGSGWRKTMSGRVWRE